MKLEHEIQYAFDKYSLLFKQRWQVLDHLFCVIGNGYEWLNGELVEKDIDKSGYTPILKDNKAYSIYEHSFSDIEFYPICEYSKIFTIPKDIKPDWLDGIKEVVKMLLEHGNGYDDYEKMNSYQKNKYVTYGKKLQELAKELNIE